MERGISKAGDNEMLVLEARHQLESQMISSANTLSSHLECSTRADSPQLHKEELAVGLVETPVYTFFLPDLTVYPGRFGILG